MTPTAFDGSWLARWLRWPGRRCCSVALALTLTTGLSGCFYVSEYVPPQDGRARILWRDNRMVAHVATTEPIDVECASAVASLSRNKELAFHGQPRFPEASTDVHYKDLLAEAHSDFFNPWLVIHLPHHDRYWPPQFFYFKSKVDADALEFGARPVFDFRLAHSRAGSKSGAGPDDPNYWGLLWQRDTARALGLFSSSHVSFKDRSRSSWAHFLLNVGFTALTPFLGITAIYPAVLSPLAAVEINHSANVVNAYNDLARTQNTPCSYSYEPHSEAKADHHPEQPE